MKKNKSLATQNSIPAKWTKEMVSKMEKTEDVGTAVYQTSQQFLLLVEQILTHYYSFSEKQIKQLELQIKDGLTTLADIEKSGLSVLTPNDMAKLGEIVEIRKQRLSAGRSGIALPSAKETEVIKKLVGGKQ